ncbi:hypothetical protein C8J57DRAFT_1223263 [Mycena rebaudengoi]|nr:hypothetical protein C8J57DRAFT_1223263 [Mycena rebaudengoi]
MCNTAAKQPVDIREIYSFEDLLTYLHTARPVPFWNCLYEVDFHPPIVQRADESAYTNDNETIFLTTLFGKAVGPVDTEGNCIITLECLEESNLAAAVRFAQQVDAAMGAVHADEHLHSAVWPMPFLSVRFISNRTQETQVDMCVSSDQPMTPYDGYLRIQTHTLEGECCVFCSGTSDCIRSFSPDVLKTGAWVVGLVSLHRYVFPTENRWAQKGLIEGYKRNRTFATYFTRLFFEPLGRAQKSAP